MKCGWSLGEGPATVAWLCGWRRDPFANLRTGSSKGYGKVWMYTDKALTGAYFLSILG